MGIVIITIPGEAKRAFANSLHRLSGEKVDLVIIQNKKPNHNSFWNRLKRLYKNVGLFALPRELWYAFLIRFDPQATEALGYFRERSGAALPDPHADYLPRVLETYSANSDEVHAALKKLSPKLLVVWGGTVLKPHIIRTASRVINLHMGLCPHYRGAVANQHAVIKKHHARIGATIHYVENRVDCGDILHTIAADLQKPPRELFRELNDLAEASFLEVAHRLYQGEKLPCQRQDSSIGENFLLKNWTPTTRYKLAQQILDWEKSGQPS